MVDARLVKYIVDQSKNGYSYQQIRAGLINYGYPIADIDDAFKSIHKSKLPLIIGVILLIVLVVAATYYLVVSIEREIPDPPNSISTPPHESFGITLSLKSSTIIIGDKLNFDILPKGSKTTGTVEYSIQDGGGNEIVYKSATFSGRTTESIELPATIDFGTYNLKAVAKAGNMGAETSSEFTVAETKSNVVVIKSNIAQPSVNYEEEITRIVDIARDDPIYAQKLCSSLEVSDQCLLDAAMTIYDTSFCPLIKNSDKKDACYFNLLLINKKKEICEKLTNDNLKETCLGM